MKLPVTDKVEKICFRLMCLGLILFILFPILPWYVSAFGFCLSLISFAFPGLLDLYL